MTDKQLKAGFGDVTGIPDAERIIAAGAYEGLPKETIQRYLQQAAQSGNFQQMGDPETPQAPEPTG